MVTVVRVPVVLKLEVSVPLELEILRVDTLWVEPGEVSVLLAVPKDEEVIAPVVVEACKIS